MHFYLISMLMKTLIRRLANQHLTSECKRWLVLLHLRRSFFCYIASFLIGTFLCMHTCFTDQTGPATYPIRKLQVMKELHLFLIIFSLQRATSFELFSTLFIYLCCLQTFSSSLSGPQADKSFLCNADFKFRFERLLSLFICPNTDIFGLVRTCFLNNF